MACQAETDHRPVRFGIVHLPGALTVRGSHRRSCRRCENAGAQAMAMPRRKFLSAGHDPRALRSSQICRYDFARHAHGMDALTISAMKTRLPVIRCVQTNARHDNNRADLVENLYELLILCCCYGHKIRCVQ